MLFEWNELVRGKVLRKPEGYNRSHGLLILQGGKEREAS